VQKANPAEALGGISKIIGKMWKELTDEEKKPYEDRAKEEKERCVSVQVERAVRRCAMCHQH